MSNINIETLELLASKICHDLISPIGAINNGLEIFEEMGADAGDEVTDLIAFSASQASAKLKAYRMAYGAGGADANIKNQDVYDILQEIIEQEKKVTQNWDPRVGGVAPELPPKGFCKMLMATLLLAKECMPRGGELTVEANSNGQTIVMARGEGAKQKDGYPESLSLSLSQSDLEPGMTHAYITGLLAQHYGFSIIAANPEENAASFTITLPVA